MKGALNPWMASFIMKEPTDCGPQRARGDDSANLPVGCTEPQDAISDDVKSAKFTAGSGYMVEKLLHNGSSLRVLPLGSHNLVIKKRVHLGVRKDRITGCYDWKDMLVLLEQQGQVQ